MTGGAFGSMIAQFFHLTSAERKTLLVAGAAAGMSATFAAPLSAVFLAVELLLFEWKPRSAIPVALASATAGAARRYMLGMGPLFSVPAHPSFIGPEGLLGCVVAGILAGSLSALLTIAVYAAEDLFHRRFKQHYVTSSVNRLDLTLLLSLCLSQLNVLVGLPALVRSQAIAGW